MPAVNAPFIGEKVAARQACPNIHYPLSCDPESTGLMHSSIVEARSDAIDQHLGDCRPPWRIPAVPPATLTLGNARDRFAAKRRRFPGDESITVLTRLICVIPKKDSCALGDCYAHPLLRGRVTGPPAASRLMPAYPWRARWFGHTLLPSYGNWSVAQNVTPSRSVALAPKGTGRSTASSNKVHDR